MLKREELKLILKSAKRLQVKEGPFANFAGSIEEIDKDKSKVKVLVNMFGRDTPVELRLYIKLKNYKSKKT